MLLILSVLACGCPNSKSPSSNSKNDNGGNASNAQAKPSVTTSASPEPSPTIAPVDVSARVKKGESIYKRISGHAGVPIMFGWRARDISIAVTAGDWKPLSKDRRIDLTYYVEHLVQEIRNDPVPYVTKWASYYKRTEQLEAGGEYDGLYVTGYLQQVRQLCNTCWNITIGKAKRDGFYDESTPVSGSTVDDFRAGTK